MGEVEAPDLSGVISGVMSNFPLRIDLEKMPIYRAKILDILDKRKSEKWHNITPVNLIGYTPNYWGAQIANKAYYVHVGGFFT